jgi:hypothetical protein
VGATDHPVEASRAHSIMGEALIFKCQQRVDVVFGGITEFDVHGFACLPLEEITRD